MSFRYFYSSSSSSSRYASSSSLTHSPAPVDTSRAINEFAASIGKNGNSHVLAHSASHLIVANISVTDAAAAASSINNVEKNASHGSTVCQVDGNPYAASIGPHFHTVAGVLTLSLVINLNAVRADQQRASEAHGLQTAAKTLNEIMSTTVDLDQQALQSAGGDDQLPHGPDDIRAKRQLSVTFPVPKVPEDLQKALGWANPDSFSSSNGNPSDGQQFITVTLCGICVECGDQPSEIYCLQCYDEYCELCFGSQHRRGRRVAHAIFIVKQEIISAPVTAPTHNRVMEVDGDITDDQDSDAELELELQRQEQTRQKQQLSYQRVQLQRDTVEQLEDDMEDEDHPSDKATKSVVTVPLNATSAYFLDRAKYIPLRLTLDERKMLRLVTSALDVSEYTDKIDIFMYMGNKPKRMAGQIREICAILCGLLLANDYHAGQKLLKDRDTFAENAQFFRTLFEIARRYKVMNPSMMRSAYGKLLHMLQDSQLEEVREMIGFDAVKPISTVYQYLHDRNAIAVIEDQYIELATREVNPDNKSRQQVQQEIKNKERAIEHLARKYANSSITDEEIRQCLYSVGDNHAFLRGNRVCCDKMLNYLTTYFRPDAAETGYDLSIMAGYKGARLSHSHRHQFEFVQQSLLLWREIQSEMFRLWYFADRDMLDGNMYHLRDTGQGLNRVKQCPEISKSMHSILRKVQHQLGHWIGSSVIHLGDHMVPNALFFLTKYIGVPWILNPVVSCLEKIDVIAKNPGIAKYLDQTFGGTEAVKREILVDFFRHAFDGSGGTNFIEAGSCIDGRLTSCWNWCQQIEKKSFFPVFLLTGFTGFDGEF